MDWPRQGFTAARREVQGRAVLTVYVHPAHPGWQVTERDTPRDGRWWWAEMGPAGGRPDTPPGAVFVDGDPARPGHWRAVFGTHGHASSAERSLAASALLAFLWTADPGGQHSGPCP